MHLGLGLQSRGFGFDCHLLGMAKKQPAGLKSRSQWLVRMHLGQGLQSRGFGFDCHLLCMA